MIDTGEIHVQAGNGGDGFACFRREKFVERGGPEGGDGGNGGSVYLFATTSENTLRRFQTNRRFRAGHGQPGSKSNKHGRSGDDVHIPVPVGTVATCLTPDGAETLRVDLAEDGQTALVAQGGGGGRGNAHFVTAVNQEPLLREAGEPGETFRVRLEVKLLADVGVIGVPNAGKSSFVGRVTAASPRVAAYPFTTLEPQLGVVENRGKPVVLAEIPGLLEGAHLGVGLGHDFLRHAERTRLFLHLVDGGALDPLADYRQVNEELAQYDPALAGRPQVVVITKSDTDETQLQLEDVTAALKPLGVNPLVMSTATGDGVQAVLDRVLQALEATPQPEEPAVATPLPARRRRPSRNGRVERDEDGEYIVHWFAAERLVTLANVDDHRVVGQLLHEFRRLGVTAALEAAGVGYGDIVQIADWTFPWGEALQPA
ncbi:MAG: GTPase ObgE [Chloroflexi bacterium]|nr:GTPase ObgE [Chloroflexota bacterium]